MFANFGPPLAMELSFSYYPTSSVLANVSPQALELFRGSSILEFLTNSVLVALLVLGIVLWFSRAATTNMTLIPHKAQNFFEFVIEFLYDRVVGIVGEKQAKLAFPLLGTLFIYILVSNWFGLIPGVGTIGVGDAVGPFMVGEVHEPLLRPPTADLNATLAMSLSAFLVWFYLTIKELGFMGFIAHTFGAKGGLKGLMGKVVAVVFLFVGVIEVVSMILRPMTLSVRLYGNIFAGESVLHTLGALLDNAGFPWSFMGSVLIPFPFYFMELLVGLLQAIVFTLLCSVYIQLSTTHDEHHEEEGHH